MTIHEQSDSQTETSEFEDGSPENVPPKAWVSLVGFAAFVVLFGTCAFTYMFN